MGKSSLVKAAHAAVNASVAQGRPAQAGRNPPRGHREPAGADGAAARRALPLHRVLRRPVVRRRRHLLQVAQGGAGRRHRGPAGERDLLRHLEPPPPDAARHDGERALDRDQSGRGGRGEGLAVGPLRPVARLPPLQPGRISRHGRGLCRPFQAFRSSADELRREALEWATTRGSRSGRVAWQYVQDLAGRLGVKLSRLERYGR